MACQWLWQLKQVQRWLTNLLRPCSKLCQCPLQQTGTYTATDPLVNCVLVTMLLHSRPVWWCMTSNSATCTVCSVWQQTQTSSCGKHSVSRPLFGVMSNSWWALCHVVESCTHATSLASCLRWPEEHCQQKRSYAPAFRRHPHLLESAMQAEYVQCMRQDVAAHSFCDIVFWSTMQA